MNIPLSPSVPENLVSRDGFSRPVPRQPAHLHTQAESGAYLRDSSRVPRIGWRKHNQADHPISYLDMLIKTGSESVEASTEDTRLPKCVMFGELVRGAGCVGGQENEWMGCFLEDPRASGINAYQWTTAAQDEGEWRRTAEQGAEHFMAKYIVPEKTKAGLRHAVVCPNVTGRIKERIAESKRARAGSLAVVDKTQVARTCMLRAFGLQMS